MRVSIWLLLVFITCFVNSSAQQWLDKIIPGETTLEEIGDIVGVEPKVLRAEDASVSLKEGNLFLGVSPGRCSKNTWGAWNMEKGTIIYVVFYPKKKQTPKKLNLEHEGMTEGFDSGHKTFKSDEIGLYYSTQFGKVMSIRLFPSSSYDKLRCH